MKNKSKEFYLVGAIEVEKVSETCFEFCHHCNSEVELKTEFKVQPCPSCGKSLKPCNLCLPDVVKCSECPLD